jgi:hypothetical protein
VLGNAREEIEVLRGAIDYLTRHRARREHDTSNAINTGEQP